MGDWEMKNTVDNSTVELEQSEKYYYKNPDAEIIPQRKSIFESFNMKMENLQILYNYSDYEKLIQEDGKNF